MKKNPFNPSYHLFSPFYFKYLSVFFGMFMYPVGNAHICLLLSSTLAESLAVISIPLSVPFTETNSAFM